VLHARRLWRVLCVRVRNESVRATHTHTHKHTHTHAHTERGVRHTGVGGLHAHTTTLRDARAC
jgi:hypothetical protein